MGESPGHDATAILERVGLPAFAESLKLTDAPVATVETAAEGWIFAANSPTPHT